MVLSAEQVVPRRPFTSVTNYQRDRSILSMMLNDLRSHLSGIQAQVIHVEPYERVSWTKGGGSSAAFWSRITIGFRMTQISTSSGFSRTGIPTSTPDHWRE